MEENVYESSGELQIFFSSVWEQATKNVIVLLLFSLLFPPETL